MGMIFKRCNECGVECWHNPRSEKNGGHRCTYCGVPPQGDSSSFKRAYQTDLQRKQAARARLLGATNV